MADSLWLQLPRDRVVERGYGSSQLPREASESRRLTGNFAIDPLTGYATARVVGSMEDVYGWSVGLPEYLTSTPWPLPGGGFGEAVSHRAKTVFTCYSTDAPDDGDGFLLGFICYGDSQPFTLSYGRYQWQFDAGRVIWLMSGEEVARGQLWHAEEWETAPHFLYVYAIGSRLACRRLGKPVADLDPGLLIETGAKSGAEALSGDWFTMAGNGFLTWAIAPERHEETGWLLRQPSLLPEPSTQTPTMTVAKLLPAGAALDEALLGMDGAAIAVEGPYNGFGYQLNFTLSATGPNLYITRVRVAFPKLVENDEVTPVDLCTFDPAGLGGTGVVRSVTMRRGPEPESAGLSMELLTVTDDVAPYLQPHMKGRWEPSGTPWMTFYTSRPELRPELNSDTLRLECESPWKLFKLAKWSGSGSYGGWYLSEAYRDVAVKAGIDSDDVVLHVNGYELPEEQADDKPLFEFQKGQPLSEVLLYLRDQFGAQDRLCFKADGKLHIEPRPTTASGTVFVWSTPADQIDEVAAGTCVVPRIHDWREGFTEDGLANDVWVVGQHRSGRPLVAVATDWDSVRNPLARNYVAGFRQLTVIDAGLSTQGLVNLVARTMLEKARWPRLTAQMRGTAVAGLYEHDIVEITGKGLWRIWSMAVTWDDQMPQGETDYELEYFGPAEGS